MNKSRAVLASEALKAAMPADYEGNLGLNEAYRQGLEDMVNWIDLDTGTPLLGVDENE